MRAIFTGDDIDDVALIYTDEDSEITEMRIVMRVILTVKYGENSYIQR